jgi:ATP-dependent RNA helicase DeaD
VADVPDASRLRDQELLVTDVTATESAATAVAEPNGAPAPDADATPTFEDLGLNAALLKSIKDVGYEAPTPIQIETIPVLLEGRDVIAQAQTGSGKTAAFGLPIIEAVDPRTRAVQALILAPTRELAIQVAEALHKYGRHKEVDTLPIYGGQPYERQFRGLQRGVQIVVGTPGRVMDHMRRGTLKLDNVRFFVLDEADEMLDMGFIEDIEWILEQAPEDRQMALFSATIPPRIADLARRYLNEPQRITVAGKQMTVPQVHQSSYEVPRARKVDALTRILDAETPQSAMIFCRTKVGVDELGEALMARGHAVETLHGDLSQAQRDRVMRRFRSGQADVLIATDVAARGLDIPDVSHVINYDIPESAEAYVHRIGRTGRAGRAGEAITLITPREVRWLRQIERTIKARIEPRRLPTLADVAERRREALKQQVRAVLDSGDDGFATYLDTINDLADEHDAAEVAAAILKLYAEETGRTTTPEQQEDDVATFAAAAPTQRGPRSETGMVRLFVNVGRNQGARPQDFVGAIANEAGIPGRAIGAIDIFDDYAFVDIPQEFVDRVLAAMRGAKIKGRPVNAEVARPDAAPPRERGGYRGGPPPGGQRRPPPYVGGARVNRDGGERPQRRYERSDRQDRSGPPRFRSRRDDERG